MKTNHGLSQTIGQNLRTGLQFADRRKPIQRGEKSSYTDRFETEGQWKRGGTTVDSLAKELKLALQYPEGAAV